MEVTALAAGGDGLARREDGYVIFVPDGVPGDRLEVRLTHVKKGHAFGKLLRVLEPSADRVRPPCIVADRCGSCQWQAVDYQRQLAAKADQVRDALERLGGFVSPPVQPVLAQTTGHRFGYRNKSTFPIGRNPKGELAVGYYRKDSHRIVNLHGCPVQDPRLDPLLVAARETIRCMDWQPYDEATHTGMIRHLGLRIGERTGERLLTFVVREDRLPGIEEAARRLMDALPTLVGVCLNVNPRRGNTIFGEHTRCVAGRSYLEEVFDGFTFRIEPTTFFQICTAQAEVMARLVVDLADPRADETLVDAYCGIGTLTLPLARRAGQVIGIENHPRSIEQARFNAGANGLSNCRFELGTVESRLADFPADLVTLDPPRRGCDPRALAAILAHRPRRVVYVSCNPATLARDLSILSTGGYELNVVQPVDLFAQTHHVESVARLDLKA